MRLSLFSFREADDFKELEMIKLVKLEVPKTFSLARYLHPPRHVLTSRFPASN